MVWKPRQGVEGKRPQLADLRESELSSRMPIWYVSSTVPNIIRLRKTSGEIPWIGLAEIIIAKHRNGAVGDVRLRFKSEFAKFMNVEEDIAGKGILLNHERWRPDAPDPIAGS